MKSGTYWPRVDGTCWLCGEDISEGTVCTDCAAELATLRELVTDDALYDVTKLNKRREAVRNMWASREEWQANESEARGGAAASLVNEHPEDFYTDDELEAEAQESEEARGDG